MRKAIAFASMFLVFGSTLMAAVDAAADDLGIGSITGDSSFGGINLSVGTGSVSVEPASMPAVAADGTAYSNVLMLSGDSSLSFDGKAGEKMTLMAAVPSDGTPFGILVESDGSSETIGGESADGATVCVEYTLPSDGAYSLSAPSGNAGIYQITVE